MSYLLYCILEDFDRLGSIDIDGIENRPLIFIRSDRLGAVASKISSSAVPLDIAHLLAYEKVVEAHHGRQTVIPMRYGALFANEADIIRLLKEREEKFLRLLNHLGGCSEMGIRAIVQREKLDNAHDEQSALKSDGMSTGGSLSGRDYLDSRKAQYELRDSLDAGKKRIIELCRNELHGLFKDIKAESPVNAGLDANRAWSSEPAAAPSGSDATLGVRQSPANLAGMEISRFDLSLYFLTPRGAVKAFKDAFEKLESTAPAELFLSGPWPPYNFV